MKQITIGEKQYNIMGTAFTSCLYKKDFKESLNHDTSKLINSDTNGESMDAILVLQITYALIKTVKRDIEPFEQWVESLGKIDLYEFVVDVIEETSDATFHETEETATKQQ